MNFRVLKDLLHEMNQSKLASNIPAQMLCNILMHSISPETISSLLYSQFKMLCLSFLSILYRTRVKKLLNCNFLLLLGLTLNPPNYVYFFSWLSLLRMLTHVFYFSRSSLNSIMLLPVLSSTILMLLSSILLSTCQLVTIKPLKMMIINHGFDLHLLELSDCRASPSTSLRLQWF